MNNLIPEYNSRKLLGGIRLFLYEKKIIYLSLYRNGERKGAAGFVKAVREKDAYILDIHIRSGLKELNGSYDMVLGAGGRENAWEKIIINEGNADSNKQIRIRNGMLCIGRELYKEEELYEIRFMPDGQNRIVGKFRSKEDMRNAGSFGNRESKAAAGTADIEKTPEMENILHVADKGDKKIKAPVLEDKWEQLQQNYQTVHPFGDQRVFLTIEPKDFVVLQAPFQKLVNNSFLLHGFYNYRHLILGPDKELGGGERVRFYLGVPGTYFEREKMVAVMFGFEGFECAGAVEIGKFGYYMRRVEL